MIDPELRGAGRHAHDFEAAVVAAAASHQVRLRFGDAVLTPEIPHVYEASRVRVDRPAALAEVLAAVEDLLGGAGLAHRSVATDDALVAGALGPALEEAGWSGQRFLVMVHAVPVDRTVDTSSVRAVDLGTWAAFHEEGLREEPWAQDPAVRAAFSQWERRLAGVVDLECLLVHDDDGPVAGCQIRRRGPVAQIEAVRVLPAAQGRGLGRTVVQAALDRVRDTCELVWLAALVDDWPKELYQRLGFRAAHASWAWTRFPPRVLPATGEAAGG